MLWQANLETPITEVASVLSHAASQHSVAFKLCVMIPNLRESR